MSYQCYGIDSGKCYVRGSVFVGRVSSACYVVMRYVWRGICAVWLFRYFCWGEKIYFVSFFRAGSITRLRDSTRGSGLDGGLDIFSLAFLNINNVVKTNIFILAKVTTTHCTNPNMTLSFIVTNVLYVLINLACDRFSSFVPTSNDICSCAFTSLNRNVTFLYN